MIQVLISGCSGRMGGVLTQLISRERDMEVVGGIDPHPSERDYPIFPTLEQCTATGDVIIDFSAPGTTEVLIQEAMKRKTPVVIATTGLSESDIEMIHQASRSIALFRSGNMSLGINLVQNLISQAVKVLGSGFDVEIIEKHHRMKKDSPSGTALMLADSVREAREDQVHYTYGREGADTLRTGDEIGIHAVRGGTIVGDHEVLFAGEDELISIRHQAFSRQVFATGAIAAARFLSTRSTGLYSMKDIIVS